MNVCNFVGRLADDPELNSVNGTSVCNFTLAVGRKFKSSGGKTVDETAFLDCVAWDKGGETIAKYFEKGKPIAITASVRQEKWTDKETGAKRSRIVFRVNNFEFVPGTGNGSGGAGSDGAESDSEQPVGAGAGAGGSATGDDIPF